jgi:hypothetical protein
VTDKAAANKPAENTVIVQFEGDGSGVEDLSWGQREIWAMMRGNSSSLPLGGVRPLPPESAVADVAAGLGFIMSRHQSLRTTVRFGPDDHASQVVHAAGEIVLEVVDAGDREPSEVATAVAAGYMSRLFDYENEWPVRMAVITHRGTATHIAEAFCHLALDTFGLAVLHDDFDRHVEQPGSLTAPVTALPPLEQARRQRGPGGRRAHEASMRYQLRLFDAVPERQLTESATPRQPRFWVLNWESPAAFRALGILSARLGLSTSPVLIAAFCVALTSITVSTERAAFHLVVNNRFRPGFAGSVSPVMASCPCVVDVADAPFEEVARRAWQASLGAYKHAYYDWEAKRDAFEALAAERGVDPDWHVIFNDRRVSSRELDDASSALGPLRDELSRTALTWGEPTDMPEEKIFLNICDVPGTLSCELRADTNYVSPADMTSLVTRIESVLVDAAEAAALTGTTP